MTTRIAICAAALGAVWVITLARQEDYFGAYWLYRASWTRTLFAPVRVLPLKIFACLFAKFYDLHTAAFV